MRLQILSHTPFSTFGSLALWAKQNDAAISHTAIYDGAPFPDLREIDFLISIGDAKDERSRVESIRFLEAVMKKNIAALGVGYGAGMIAEALGATVRRADTGNKEGEWRRVRVTDEGAASTIFSALDESFDAYCSASEEVGVPLDAIRGVESESVSNEAFSFGDKIVGVLFDVFAMASPTGTKERYAALEANAGYLLRRMADVIRIG